MEQWIWSDQHFNHNNIINLAGRPFANVTEMNLEMIRLFRERVKPGDRCYWLGDTIYPPQDMHHMTFNELGAAVCHAENILIRGNHDQERYKDAEGPKIHEHWMWASVHDYLEVHFGKTKFVLCHYPFETWRNAHHGWLHLHGHCHGTLKRVIPHRMDVGVDALPDFGPIKLETVRDYLNAQKEYVPQDHHGDKVRKSMV